MAKRKYPIEVGKYYHIYNRGVDKRKIFLDKGDLYYFFDAIQISNREENISRNYKSKKKRIKEKEKAKESEPIVEIVAYALLPNHYHFVLKEITEGGISKFISKLAGSYSKYFNQKYDRSGTLFQGPFKSSPILKDGSDQRTVAYVSLNYKHHSYDPRKDLLKTSLFEYLGEEKGDKICSEKEIKRILNYHNGDMKKYKSFLKEASKVFTQEHKRSIDDLNFFELEE